MKLNFKSSSFLVIKLHVSTQTLNWVPWGSFWLQDLITSRGFYLCWMKHPRSRVLFLYHSDATGLYVSTYFFLQISGILRSLNSTSAFFLWVIRWNGNTLLKSLVRQDWRAFSLCSEDDNFLFSSNKYFFLPIKQQKKSNWHVTCFKSRVSFLCLHWHGVVYPKNIADYV